MTIRFGLMLAIASFCLHRPVQALQEPQADAPTVTLSKDRPQDVVCGPRCVQYLLRTLRPGDSSSLVDIVSAVQPDFNKGSSLASIKKHLEETGLHTFAIKPARGSALISPHLALAHIRSDDPSLGHFVVLLPESDRATAVFWSGQAGRLSVPMWEFDGMIDGGVLLVSASPISDLPVFPKTADFWLQKGAIGLLSASSIGILPLLRRDPRHQAF